MANEAKIGNTEYATLKEAFAAAKKGDTITLLTDITLTEQIDITDQDVLSGITLDGDGQTITCAPRMIRARAAAQPSISGTPTPASGLRASPSKT